MVEVLVNAKLQCPHCQFDIELTWKRYLRTLFRQTCPHCGKQSMLDWPLPYIALNLMIAVFLPVSARLLSIAIVGDEWRTTTGFRVRLVYYALALFLVWLPLDHFLCAKFRRLHKV